MLETKAIDKLREIQANCEDRATKRLDEAEIKFDNIIKNIEDIKLSQKLDDISSEMQSATADMYFVLGYMAAINNK